MDTNRLKILIKKSGHTQNEASDAVGMTPHGFNRALKNNSLKVRDLEVLCEKLQIPISEVLGETAQENTGTKKPGKKVYIEQRIDEIESEMQNCKSKLAALEELTVRLKELEKEVKKEGVGK